MYNAKKNKKRIAVLVAASLLLSQGMSVFAVAYRAESGGPGVVQQTEAAEEGSAGSEELEPQETDQTESSQEQGAGAQLQEPPVINYSMYGANQGWSANSEDNGILTTPGTWPTAFRANLINIPAECQAGIRYRVNLSGSGWLDWSDDGAETGNSADLMPLEAVSMELTGVAALSYDLYYKVYQNGAWTGWAKNGENAGQEGVGLRIDGIRISITGKDQGEPAQTTDIDPARPMIALTFDDGPRAAVTNRILDCLQQYGGRATFFMVGSNVDGNAAAVQRMAAQGCEVGNHTYNHKYISKIGQSGIISQVGDTNQKIAAICGISPVVMRPPGGYIDGASLAVLGTMGMPAIMWSIDTRDWQHRNPQKTINNVLSQVRDGDVILMHDIYSTTADAAVVLIPELTARGFQLVTVSELASFRGGIAPGHKYSQFR